MTNHRPAVPYRRHYILWRRVKISFFLFFFFFFKKPRCCCCCCCCCIATGQRRQSQSHSGNHLLALVGGILKRLSSQWKERDNGGRALRRGLWQMEWGRSEEWELRGYLGMSLKKTVDVIFPAHANISALSDFCLAFSFSSAVARNTTDPHTRRGKC